MTIKDLMESLRNKENNGVAFSGAYTIRTYDYTNNGFITLVEGNELAVDYENEIIPNEILDRKIIFMCSYPIVTEDRERAGIGFEVE